MRRFACVFVLGMLAACSSAAPNTAPTPTPSAPPARAATPAPTPAPAPAPAPAGVRPEGSFSFVTEVNGTPVAGTLLITRVNGVWGGKLTSDVFPELPVTSVLVEGKAMKVSADTPNGGVVINMTFSGDDYTGSWELGGQTGPVSGKRVK
jgi:hypothetical protein